MRGDLTCFHEPFGEAWYQGEDARWPRRDPAIPPVPGLSFDSAWHKIKSAAEQTPVFSKDFAHYVTHFLDDDFLAHINHSFLIRHPSKVVTSMYRHWPEFLPEETGYREQRELFARVCDQNGNAPVVIDSDDLLENPQGVVQAYCDAMGIAFIEEALSWEPGDRSDVSWYDSGSWHTNLCQSNGLKRQPRAAMDIADVPKQIRRIYDDVLPDYQYMYGHRLIVS